MRRLLIAALIASACSRGPQLPVNTLLWHVESWTPTATNVRRGTAKMISFRASGEYIEHICYVIEQADTSVYISTSDPHVVTIGTWKKQRPEIIATRTIIWRSTAPRDNKADPLCSESRYTISGNSVISQDSRQYSPITRLVSPDFESYINDARRSGRPCPQPPS